MHIVISGAGEVGSFLAAKLVSENHNIVLIDSDPERIANVGGKYDLLALVGNGSSPHVLEKASINAADMFIAVTNHDEVNIVASMVASRYGVPRIITRVSNEEYFAPHHGLHQEALGIDLVVNPEKLCADELTRLLMARELIESQTFADGLVQLVGFEVEEGNPLIDHTLADLAGHPGVQHVRLVVIERNQQSIIPHGDELILAGDHLYVMGAVEQIPQALQMAGISQTRAKRVVIAGGGKTARYLALHLEAESVDVRLIEENRDRSEDLSRDLHHTLVIQGSARNIQTLRNAGIEACDAFVALTNEDEDNILASILAKQCGATKVTALIQHQEYQALVTSLNLIDATVSTQLIAAGVILKLIRRGHIESVAALHEIKAEAIEVVATAGSKIVRKPLSELNFPDKAIIGAIVRNGQPLVANGDQQIEPGDHVIVFTLPEAIPKVEKFLSS